MNNSNSQKMLSFSPFISNAREANGDASVFKKAVANLFSGRARHSTDSPRTPHWETTPRPVIEPSVVSPYHVDDYGRPRILSKAEIIAHDVARMALIAAVIGYSLMIALAAIHNFSAPNPQENDRQPQVVPQEVEP